MSAENEIRNIKLFEEEIRNIKQMAFDAAHPVNETYTQYPQQDDPMTLYNKDGVTSVWEIQAQYSGAFFRSSNAPLTVYKADDEEQYYTQDSVTGALVPTNVTANGGPSVSPTPSGAPIVIEGKTYNQYAVTASSRNAADYIIKTNLLSIQSQSTAKNGLSANSSSSFGGNNVNSYIGVAGQERLVSLGSPFYYVSGTSHPGIQDGGSAGNKQLIGFSYTPSGSVSTTTTINGDTETRPMNYTQIIWKRVS